MLDAAGKAIVTGGTAVARIQGTTASNTLVSVDGTTNYTPRYVTTVPPALRWDTTGSALVVRAAYKPPHFANNTVSAHVFFYSQRVAAQWRLGGGGGASSGTYTLFSPANVAAGTRYVATVLLPGSTSDATNGVTSGVWVNGAGTLVTATTLFSDGEGLRTAAGHFDLILGAGDANAGTAGVPDSVNGARATTLIHEVRIYQWRHAPTKRTGIESGLRTKWGF